MWAGQAVVPALWGRDQDSFATWGKSQNFQGNFSHWGEADQRDTTQVSTPPLLTPPSFLMSFLLLWDRPRRAERVEGVWSSRNCFGLRTWKTEILLSYPKLVQWDLPISCYLPIFTSFWLLFSKGIFTVSLPKTSKGGRESFNWCCILGSEREAAVHIFPCDEERS